MLTFVPHLRDLDSSEESKYNLWLKELEEIDTKSGFKPMNREEKVIQTIQTERAATVSLYLKTWLEKLCIANCTTAALIAHMASQQSDDKITPQKKTDIIRSSRETADGDPTSQDSRRAAALFTDAFKEAFEDDDLPLASKIELRRILALEESVDSVLAPKPAAKEASVAPQGELYDVIEDHLCNYLILGCLICYSHSCDHGDYDVKNFKKAFSLSGVMPLAELLTRRRQKRMTESTDALPDAPPCRRECYLLSPPVGQMRESKAWVEKEIRLLKSIFSTLGQSKLQRDPICFSAEILDRECSDVYAKFESLAVKMPEVTRPEPVKIKKTLPWYDNRRKILIGDWQDRTKVHDYPRREVIEPCSHEGACTSQNCSCVKANILCEKWCNCTADTCSYKFTGCACHSSGKSCHAKQKEKPCICVQLTRECDPELCRSCGVLERADPTDVKPETLYETGCQNCEIQRGLTRKLLLGQSQLDGVGYGLFTAEDIGQDDFVIEYVGELISHDEGVRREARRGDVFDEDSHISYVFTLLENEGIWVDAAIYGNLSRYINHASEHDRTGSNITPTIFYVNGEYRIKFTALRDIQAGEELFFNYGENFPNLTKKLLDTKTREKQGASRKSGRPRLSATSKGVARKAPKPNQKKTERKKPSNTRGRQREAVDDDDENDTMAPYISPLNRPVKRKRVPKRADSDEDDGYRTRGRASRNQWQESAAEDEDGLGEETTPTGGVQTRRSLRARTSETPTKGDKTKAAGRRGGARPGSGRPRKHPRALPQAASEGTETGRQLRESPRTSWREDLSQSPRTPRTTRRTRAEPDEDDEIRDSQESDTTDEERAARGYSAASEEGEDDSEDNNESEKEDRVDQNEDNHGDDDQEEEEQGEDGTDEDSQSDGDDQDIIVRKRMDRATRTRRPPAKFRGEDF